MKHSPARISSWSSVTGPVTGPVTLALSLAIALAVGTPGCRRSGDDTPNRSVSAGQAAGTDGSGSPARSIKRQDGVQLEVSVTPNPVPLSGSAVLRVKITYPTGVLVRKPTFGPAIGEFKIRDIREPIPRRQGEQVVMQITCELQPPRAGQLVVLPIPITYTDSRDGVDPSERLLQSDPIAVSIATEVDATHVSLDEAGGLSGPVEMELRRGLPKWLLIIAVFPLLGGALLAWLIVVSRRSKPEVAVSPRERAYRELQDLLARGLAQQDVKLFYVELTGIVRRYIERAFEIRAPEQTTEEFLRAISGRDTFGSAEQDRLISFLQAADLVKYAGHQPLTSDIELTFERAKEFIGIEDGRVRVS